MCKFETDGDGWPERGAPGLDAVQCVGEGPLKRWYLVPNCTVSHS